MVPRAKLFSPLAGLAGGGGEAGDEGGGAATAPLGDGDGALLGGGDTGVLLGDGDAGAGVLVGGTGVAVGGTRVAVGGTEVAVGGTGVTVGGTGVAVDGTGVSSGPADSAIGMYTNPAVADTSGDASSVSVVGAGYAAAGVVLGAGYADAEALATAVGAEALATAVVGTTVGALAACGGADGDVCAAGGSGATRHAASTTSSNDNGIERTRSMLIPFGVHNHRALRQPAIMLPARNTRSIDRSNRLRPMSMVATCPWWQQRMLTGMGGALDVLVTPSQTRLTWCPASPRSSPSVPLLPAGRRCFGAALPSA